MKKEWFHTGFFSHGILNVSPKDCFELCKKGAFIIDARENYLSSFKMFRVENLIYLPYSELKLNFAGLPTDCPLIFADTVGLKSRECVLFMKAHGYENVASLAGGIVDWERDGLPVNTDLNSRLSGSCMCQIRARETKKTKPF